MIQNRQGADEQDDERNTLQRRLLLIPLCIAVFSLSALFYYHLRQDVIAVQSPLQVTYAALYRTFGFAPSLMFFLLLLIWTSIWFFTGRVERPWSRLVRLLATTVMLGVFLNVGEAGAPSAALQQGELGAFFAVRLVAAFGYYPTLILVLVATLGALLLATDFLFSETFERLWARSTDADSGGAATDIGVEDAVTDHLKGLAASAPPTVRPVRPIAGAGDGLPVGVSSPEDDAGIAAEAFEFAEPEAEVEPTLEDPLPESHAASEARRLSYFERRYQDVQRAGEAIRARPVEPEEARQSAEDWLPGAPETQEIDNLEFAAAVGAASSEDAVVFDSAEATDEDSEDRDEDEAAESGATYDEEVVGEDDEQRAEDFEDDTEVEDVEDDTGVEEDDDIETDDIEDDEGFESEEFAEDEADEPDAEAESDADHPDPEYAEEPLFTLPRPEPRETPEPEPASREPASTRQQKLFGSDLDEDLIVEARQVVIEARRASASFLRRRLRIGYDEACEVLAELSARGVVELGEDAGQARVIEE